MNWRNSTESYGMVSILLHWLVASAVFGLFGLGVWMVEIHYYDPWYLQAPHLHKSAGVLLFGVMLLRWGWRYANPQPRLYGSPLEARLALAVHRLMYALLLLLIVSGYLISTADGRALDVFGLFSVPATLSGLPRQEDTSGLVHRVLAFAVIGLSVAHAGAALKHHFVDRDGTLKRMLAPPG